MFQKLRINKVSTTPRLEPHTMQVQRFGEMSLMGSRVIFGHLAVSCMSLLPCNHRFKRKICKVFTKR